MKHLAILLLTLIAFSPTFGQHEGGHDSMAEEDAVKAVVVSGYIEGMHINRDAAAANAAFHPEFIMHVAREGKVSQVTLEQWTSRLNGEKNEHEITYEFEWVDVTGTAAKVKIKVFEDGEHIFTDYLGLYKFEDGWMIVNKIFVSH